MHENFVKEVLELYNKNDWKSIINLNKHSDNNEALKLLWVWPSEENLKFIKNVLEEYGVSGIISLGCGCGLLEWIIHSYTSKYLKNNNFMQLPLFFFKYRTSGNWV